MSSQNFTLRKLLRNPNNRLLERFFTRSHIRLPGIDWNKLPGHAEEQLLAAVLSLPPDKIQTTERRLSEIYELCSNSGLESIFEAARILNIPDLAQKIPHASHFNIAMWTSLEFPLVFDQALTLHSIDQLRWAKKQLNLPKKQPRRSQGTLIGLAQGISNLFQIEEGRGKNCTVRHIHRDDQIDCFLAYTDNYVQSIPIHDQNGDFSTLPVRPTFEIVFVFNHVEGSLELYAKMSSHMKKALIRMFGQLMLNKDIDPHRFQHAYDPNRIRDSYFALPTDPADAVRAEVVSAWFADKRLGKVGLVPPQGGDVLQMSQHLLNHSNAKWNQLNLQKVTIQFRFDARPGRRARRLTCDVSYPSHCSVRSSRPEYINLVRKYLKRWRVALV